MSALTPSLATPYRTHTNGELRASDAGSEARLAGWIHRRRDHGQLIFLDLRDRHGLTQIVIDQTEAPAAHEQASRIRPEFVVAVRGEVSKAPARHREPAAADRRDRAPGDRSRDPVRGEDAAVLHQRAGRAGRRGGAAQVPLPRHPPPADGGPAPPALAHGPGDPRGPPRERLRRGRDAHAHQEHARGRPRLHRAVPAPARDGLRAPAEPAAAQAAPDGRRDGSLLPDRPLLPRRGPARRPPARVHAARPGDELRRRGDRHGLRRIDGDRGLAGRPGQTARSCRRRSRSSPTTRSSSGSARTSRTSGSGWSSSTSGPSWSAPTARRRRGSASSTTPWRRAAASRRSWHPAWPGSPGARSTSSSSVRSASGPKAWSTSRSNRAAR